MTTRWIRSADAFSICNVETGVSIDARKDGQDWIVQVRGGGQVDELVRRSGDDDGKAAIVEAFEALVEALAKNETDAVFDLGELFPEELEADEERVTDSDVDGDDGVPA